MDIFFAIFALCCLGGAFMICIAVAGAVIAVLDK
jgi:hypothetical protein